MEIEIIKPGLLSTLQDQGRLHYRHIGVPVSGAMDPFAASVANILLGNEENAAVIEISFSEFSFRAISNIVVACTGPGFRWTVDGNEIHMWQAAFIPAGSKVIVQPKHEGVRAYLAIAGGWFVEPVLESRSTYLPLNMGGYQGRALQAHDMLSNDNLTDLSKLIVQKISHTILHTFHWGVQPQLIVDYNKRKIRIIEGQEAAWFTKDSIAALQKTPFVVDILSNRMGYQIRSKPLQRNSEQEMLSAAVTMGTIQVSNNGSPILLMADCQTTGGYPRIGQVIAADLPICAQLKPGDEIRFELISLESAEEIYRNYLNELTLVYKMVELRVESDDAY
ncbi:MAG: biotin-dependent carboxyltransferase family protein [Chitinophagaceae bacterium]|nr:MAG: biotin-dependent carboxyltransferase family protein [Chitinophagaceae bacterium]